MNWESFISAINNSKPALGMDFVVELSKIDDNTAYVRCYLDDDPDDTYEAKLKLEGTYKGNTIISVEMDGTIALVSDCPGAVWSMLYSGI